MKTRLLSAMFLCTLLLVSCRSSNDSAARKDMGDKMPDVGPGVPPNHCRLVGTVMSIDQGMMGKGDDPCAKAPCVAEVRVDEILGYGSAFGGPLATGKNIRVKFRYTTGPTKDLFPEMSPALPGLKVGSQFQADVNASGPSMNGSDDVRFQVGSYTVK